MNLHNFSDKQLMVLFRHGRAEAFDLLFARHRQKIFALCWRLTGRREDAEEALQETFLRVARAAPGYQPTAQWSTWLHRIAVNVCLNHHRRQTHAPQVISLDAARPSPTAHHGVVHDDPLDKIQAQETGLALQDALQTLPAPWRAAFVLRVFEDMGYSQIAQTLDIAPGTAKTHVHRARAALRRRLKPILQAPCGPTTNPKVLP